MAVPGAAAGSPAGGMVLVGSLFLVSPVSVSTPSFLESSLDAHLVYSGQAWFVARLLRLVRLDPFVHPCQIFSFLAFEKN